jgi:hypothetical protein
MEEENKAKEIKELQRLKEEEKERNRQLQKQKEEEIKKIELEFLKDKVKKAKRLRIYLYILIILLVGFLYAIIDAGKSDTEARIALANVFIEKKSFIQADSVLKSRNLFSFLNFYSKDSLTKLNNQIKTEMLIQREYIKYNNIGDSLFQSSSLLLRATDSLLLIADSLAGQNNLESRTNFVTIGNKLKGLLDWSGLQNARENYLIAQQTGYKPISGELSASSLLSTVNGNISYSFKQCMDLANVFLKANDEKSAKEVLEKSEMLYSFAIDSTRNIPLNPDDTLSLFNLKKNLNHEK